MYLATKSKAGTAAMMAMIIYLGTMVLFSTLTSVSRLTWAVSLSDEVNHWRRPC